MAQRCKLDRDFVHNECIDEVIVSPTQDTHVSSMDSPLVAGGSESHRFQNPHSSVVLWSQRVGLSFIGFRAVVIRPKKGSIARAIELLYSTLFNTNRAQ